MESKLFVAITAVEQARTVALETAIEEWVYRAAALLDSEGPIQRALNRVHRLLVNEAPEPEPEPTPRRTKKSKQ